MNVTEWHELCARFEAAWRDHSDSQVLGSILREQADWIAVNVELDLPVHVEAGLDDSAEVESLTGLLGAAMERDRDARAELSRLRGVVEAVQALADEWGIFTGDDDDFHEAIGDSGAWRFARDLRAALAPVSSGEADAEVAALRSAVEALADDWERAAGGSLDQALPFPALRTLWEAASDLRALLTSGPSGGRDEAFAELLPPDVGHNLRHFGPETAHVTGAECHCHPEPIPHVPAPVPSGGQEDGEGVRLRPDEIERLDFNYQVGDGRWLFTEVEGIIAARLAARPVLSREALRARLDGHWPETHSQTRMGCECGWSEGPDSDPRLPTTQYRDHLADVLADVLAGGEQA